MCDVTGRSRLVQRTSRPRWGLLYATTALMLAALAAVEFVASPGTGQTLLRSGLVLGGFGAMALWARLNVGPSISWAGASAPPQRSPCA